MTSHDAPMPDRPDLGISFSAASETNADQVVAKKILTARKLRADRGVDVDTLTEVAATAAYSNEQLGVVRTEGPYALIDPEHLVSSVTHLMRMRPNREAIDAIANELCAAAVAGDASEDTVRTLLLGLVHSSDVITATAENSMQVLASDSERHLSEELQEAMSGALAVKILGVTDPTGFIASSHDKERSSVYDLKIGVDSSLCGWSRFTLSNAAQTAFRSVLRRVRREGGVADPDSDEYRAAGLASGLHGSASVHSNPASLVETDGSVLTGVLDPKDEKSDGVISLGPIEDYIDQLSNVRGVISKRRAAVGAIAEQRHLPAAFRPDCFESRSLAWEALEEDPTLAYRSLAAYSHREFGTRKPENMHGITEVFMGLWANFDEDQVEYLRCENPKISYLFAMDALAPWVRPRGKLITTLSGRIAGKGKGREWRNLAAAFTRSWVAVNFFSTSEFANHASTDPEARHIGAVIAASQYDHLISTMMASDGVPMGATREAIERNMLCAALVTLGSPDIEQHVELRHKAMYDGWIKWQEHGRALAAEKEAAKLEAGS